MEVFHPPRLKKSSLSLLPLSYISWLFFHPHFHSRYLPPKLDSPPPPPLIFSRLQASGTIRSLQLWSLASPYSILSSRPPLRTIIIHTTSTIPPSPSTAAASYSSQVSPRHPDVSPPLTPSQLYLPSPTSIDRPSIPPYSFNREPPFYPRKV
uniref:Uncharacterized protein n=1 Tax=Knipowitschia caucasica TaxID=637954 RepID=A0AAV2K5E5_KNICA